MVQARLGTHGSQIRSRFSCHGQKWIFLIVFRADAIVQHTVNRFVNRQYMPEYLSLVF